MGCPHCSSHIIVRNGHHYGGKLHFLCKSCQKHFSEDVLKGYPTSKIPYPIIAYLLYFRKKVPTLSNMRTFRKFVSQWLRCLEIRTRDVSRQTIHHWIKNYEPGLEKIISFEEACDCCHRILSEKLEIIPKEIVRAKSVPHKVALKVLEENFGREFCFDLIHRDEVFFNELCEITSKYKVYCWKLLDKEQMGHTKRLFLARSKKM